MNTMIVVGAAPRAADVSGSGGVVFIGALAVAGLILLIGALRSVRRAPVYVVRDIGRRF